MGRRDIFDAQGYYTTRFTRFAEANRLPNMLQTGVVPHQIASIYASALLHFGANKIKELYFVELCCGSGIPLKFLQDSLGMANTRGLDCDGKALSVGTHYGVQNLVNCNIAKRIDPIAPHSVDAIGATNIIDALGSVYRELSEELFFKQAQSMLKAQGILIIFGAIPLNIPIGFIDITRNFIPRDLPFIDEIQILQKI